MTAPRLDEAARGVFPISATPFAPDGALDIASLDRLIDFYLARRIHGLTLLGIMGEAPKLTPAESRALGRVAGRVPVVVGVSNAELRALAALANDAMAAGAAGVMVAPAPGLAGDDALIDYMASVFTALDPATPVVYQDYPQATGVPLTVETFHRMVEAFPRLVMLKHEDCPGLTKLGRIRAEAARAGRRRVSVLVGNNAIYSSTRIGPRRRRCHDGVLVSRDADGGLRAIHRRRRRGRGGRLRRLPAAAAL